MKLTRTKMKRGCKCVGQTIKLSKTCVQPPPPQRLVCHEVKKSCPTPGHRIQSCKRTTPVCVKICSRRDLDKMCQPKLSPQKLTPQSSTGIITGCVKFVFKTAIAAGLVYWTTAEGLWGDGYETEDLYYRIAETVEPVLPGEADIENLELPDLEVMKENVREAYNAVVFGVMKAVIAVPLTIEKRISSFLFSCDPSEDAVLTGRNTETGNKSDSGT